jgi:poly-gamma-glutamate biosynthesis protein PgsC/CapC
VHDYLFSSEIVRFAFVFGICVSMMLYERLHLTTGSIVVPGYIAVFLVYPMVVVATFVNALLSYAIMNHFLRKHFMLYGRTKFTLMALISISIQTVMLKLSPSGPWLWESNIPLFVGAGYVVPALIAHDMGRQGIKRTTKAVLLAGVIVSLPIALALLLQLKGVNDLAPLAGFGTMSIANRWIPTAVLLSALGSFGVAHNYNLKAGGFVGAAYVGMFMGDPYQVAVAFTIAIVTFLLVRYVLMNVLILFGRRKFSAMLLTSSMLSWTLLWVGPSFFSSRVTNHLDLASMALTPLFVPGLLANDMDRTSPLRVVTGCGLAAAFVVPTTWWIQSLVEGTTLGLQWMLLSMATFVTIFWKSARQLYRHYRPAKAVEDAEVEGDTDDFDFDDVLEAADDVSVWTPLVEYEVLPTGPTFDREFEPEFVTTLATVFDREFEPEFKTTSATVFDFEFEREFEEHFDDHHEEQVHDHFLEQFQEVVEEVVEVVVEEVVEVVEEVVEEEAPALVAVVEAPTWPEVERRRAVRPWSDRPAATVPDDLSSLDWKELVPVVYSIDSTAWSPKGIKRWQDAHPDAWEDADRWLAEALTPSERNSRVA